MKRIQKPWLSLFILFLISSFPMLGNETESKKTPHRIPEITSKVKIDGVLDPQEWSGALVLILNYEVDPGENIAPPVKTEVYLAYDSKYLYAGFRAFDPDPSQIRARVTDRDNIYNDDIVGIALDTFNDSRLTHNFFCNPFGIQADEIFTLSQGSSEWDAIWDSAGRINQEGYCVEMAIPFTSLRFQGKKGDQVWGIDAVRSYPRSVSHTIGLFPRNRNNNCYMCQSDKVEGFSGAKPGRNLEFDPTISGILTQERDPFPNGEFKDTKKEAELGLTARWSVTPNLTLNAAVNPDFSQVEADYAQLDANTQFALFFPEKRPFFMEGSNIFESRFLVVYTRTVADPIWGIKLTGKEKTHSIAFFSVEDNVTNLIMPSSENSSLISLDMKNVSTALRYRKDIGRSSNLGFFITDREGKNYFNRLVGVDGEVRFNRKNLVAFQYLTSQTRYPDDVARLYDQPIGKFSGGAFDGIYTHSTRKVLANIHYQDVSPNYRSDVGFADQTGTRLYEVNGRLTWRKNPGFWYTRLNFGGAFNYMTDYDKRLLYRNFQSWFVYYGPIQSIFQVQANTGKRTYFGNKFNNNYININFVARPSASLFFGLMTFIGDQVDFQHNRKGNRIRLNPNIQYNAGRRLFLLVDHIYERLNVDAGRLYTANLTNFTSVYQFNRRAFLRVMLQYSDTNYNSRLYMRPRNPRYRHLFSQVLFSYKINPQTVLYLGYSDDYQGNSVIPIKQSNRTFFMKIGYALVL